MRFSAVTVEPPHVATPPLELRYLAYVRRRKAVEVTYCRLLSLAL